jgi:hypothetical protein
MITCQKANHQLFIHCQVNENISIELLDLNGNVLQKITFLPNQNTAHIALQISDICAYRVADASDSYLVNL